MSTELKPLCRLDVELLPPLDVGKTPFGFRRVIPICGGTLKGERLNGVIVDGGADWNAVREDGVTHIWARYTLKTDDGVYISITNEGWGRINMDAIMSGEPMTADDWYAKVHTRFEVAEGPYDFLNKSVFIGELLPPQRPDRVSVLLYELL